MGWAKKRIGYCSNVHPGESSVLVEENIKRYTAPLRQTRGLTSMQHGLWLSKQACTEYLSDSKKLEGLKQSLKEHHLSIGGGAVIDAVGYAVSTAHRGVRLIRLPTTVLAQNDAGLGVKNAINLGKRKNFIGTFSSPWAVICDCEFLTTLSLRDKRAGMAEAIKISLVQDKNFFDFLYEQRHSLAHFEKQATQKLIEQCAKIHLERITKGGDPFEHGSARPLDFGHWIAHKLEELSQNEIKHGEAVAIGIAIDSHYSYQLKWLSKNELNLILELLTTLGFDLNTPFLNKVITETALDEFRQQIGGFLTITLLKSIGLGQEVNTIDNEMMANSIHSISQYQSPN